MAISRANMGKQLWKPAKPIKKKSPDMTRQRRPKRAKRTFK